MLDCRHASQLLSQAMDRRLSLHERLGLRLHLMLCDACTQFSRQLGMLREALRRLGRRVENDENLVLSQEARARIAEAVARYSRQSGEAGQNPDQDSTD